MLNPILLAKLDPIYRDELALLWRSPSFRIMIDLHVHDASQRLLQLRANDFETSAQFVAEHASIRAEYDFWQQLARSLTEFASTQLEQKD